MITYNTSTGQLTSLNWLISLLVNALTWELLYFSIYRSLYTDIGSSQPLHKFFCCVSASVTSPNLDQMDVKQPGLYHIFSC